MTQFHAYVTRLTFFFSHNPATHPTTTRLLASSGADDNTQKMITEQIGVGLKRGTFIHFISKDILSLRDQKVKNYSLLVRQCAVFNRKISKLEERETMIMYVCMYRVILYLVISGF